MVFFNFFSKKKPENMEKRRSIKARKHKESKACKGKQVTNSIKRRDKGQSNKQK